MITEGRFWKCNFLVLGELFSTYNWDDHGDTRIKLHWLLTIIIVSLELNTSEEIPLILGNAVCQCKVPVLIFAFQILTFSTHVIFDIPWNYIWSLVIDNCGLKIKFILLGYWKICVLFLIFTIACCPTTLTVIVWSLSWFYFWKTKWSIWTSLP